MNLIDPAYLSGRPLGPYSFVQDPEQRIRRPPERQKPGPKPLQRDSHTRDLISAAGTEIAKLSPQLMVVALPGP
jgi:hypothetical protein